tara:strand:- start:871 stop:1386 length:516 start_codon:yes stop_codon:yes gene_type:complete
MFNANIKLKKEAHQNSGVKKMNLDSKNKTLLIAILGIIVCLIIIMTALTIITITQPTHKIINKLPTIIYANTQTQEKQELPELPQTLTAQKKATSANTIIYNTVNVKTSGTNYYPYPKYYPRYYPKYNHPHHHHKHPKDYNKYTPYYPKPYPRHYFYYSNSYGTYHKYYYY